MTLTLTSAEQARFTATARALLSPLDLPALDDWRASVLESLASLVNADSGGFILDAPGEMPYTLHNLPDSFGQEYFEQGWDREVSRGLMRELGGGVWSTRLVGERLGLDMPEGFYRSEEYRGFYGRYGIRDSIGFTAIADQGYVATRRDGSQPALREGLLTCFHHVYGTEYFGERGVELLRLLVPALEAGITTRLRLAGRQRALEAAFEASPYGIGVYGAGRRRPQYRNRAMVQLLEEEPERRRLRAAVQAAVGSLARVAAGEGPVTGGLDGTSRQVRTTRARYQLRLSLIGEGLFTPRPAIMATLERLPPDPHTLSPRLLRERWQLTPQEARVAVLLARGRTNRQIAAAMKLSPATTRHYTEALFLKLDVHSRAQATAKILTG